MIKMEYLKLIVDLIAAIVWPLTLILFIIYYKNKVGYFLDVIIKRFEKTSQVELPGGFKAIFFKEKVDSIKKIAHEAISSVSGDLPDEQKQEIERKIHNALLNNELTLLILSHISAVGISNRNRVYQIFEESKIDRSEIDKAIDDLNSSGYIIQKEGSFQATYVGVNRLRHEESKPKLSG